MPQDVRSVRGGGCSFFVSVLLSFAKGVVIYKRINMNYNQNREFVNTRLEKIEKELIRGRRPVLDMLGATPTEEPEGTPGSDARPLARGTGGPAALRSAVPPFTNRGVESSHCREFEWESRRAAVSDDGIKYFGGVDGSSEVLLYGNPLPPDLIAELDEYRKQAIETRKPVDVVLGGVSGRLSAAPRGSVGYSWRFDCGGLTLLLHRAPSDCIPVCKIVLGFFAVDQTEPAALVQWVKDFLRKFRVKVERDHIRRLDLQITAACRIDEYAAAGTSGCFITYQQKKRTDENAGRVQTITWGNHDSPISFKIYDKTTELFEGGDCAKMEAITSRFADGPEEEWFGPMTRFEFSLTRDFLKRFEINTFQDYEEKRLALVNYLVYNWFRLTEQAPDRENKHQTRAKTSPIWDRVQKMFQAVFASPVATFARVKKEVSAFLTDAKINQIYMTLAGYYSNLLTDAIIKEGPAQGEKTISETVARFAEGLRDLFPVEAFQRLIHKTFEKVQKYLSERRARTIPPELLEVPF